MSLLPLLKDHIAEHGALSIADYMLVALGHEQFGYYMRRDPLGIKGDFITAPEISQVFGELIGAFVAYQWQLMGGPKATLAELGPGRGTLMADILRATKHMPGFHDAIDVQMVEISPTLRAKQQQTLSGAHPRITWQERLKLPDQPLLVVANEFFDALPIRQYAGDKERLIVENDNALAFNYESKAVTSEVCEAALAITASISAHIATFGGMALIIDYGYTSDVGGDTLQAVKNHEYHDVLHAPGEADLTAHVNFAALKKTALENGAAVYGTITQGEFLTQMGAGIRIQHLCAHATAEQKIALVSGVERLISLDKMGDLFKVLCITHKAHPAPEGF